MVGGHPAGQQVVGEPGSGLLLAGDRMEILARRAAQAGGLHVHQHRIRVRRLERGTGGDDPIDDLEQNPDIARLAAEVGRPEPALAAIERGDDRLVEWGVPVHQLRVPLGEGGSVSRDGRGVVGTRELAPQPERTAVVHQVYDRCDAQLLDQIGEHLVGPAPVELARLEGLHPIPRNTPPHRLQAQLPHQREVLAPVPVVTHELVLVQRTMPGPGLRNERVLDAGGPEKVLGATAGHESRAHPTVSMESAGRRREPVGLPHAGPGRYILPLYRPRGLHPRDERVVGVVVLPFAVAPRE